MYAIATTLNNYSDLSKEEIDKTLAWVNSLEPDAKKMLQWILSTYWNDGKYEI